MSSDAELEKAGKNLDAGFVEDAIDQYTFLLIRDGFSARVAALRGYAYYKANQFDEAINDLEMAIRAVPKAKNSLFILGKCQAITGRMDEALNSLNMASLLDPQSADIFTEIGMINQYKGDNASALAAFNRALKIDPEDEIARLGLNQLNY